MERFSVAHRIQADSNAEITSRMEHAATELRGRVTFRGRRVRPGPLLNGLAWWFVRLDPDEQAKVAEMVMRDLELAMEGEPPGPPPRMIERGPVVVIDPVSAQRVAEAVEETRKGKRSRRSGA